MLPAVAAIGTLAFIIVGGAIGARLLWLARSTRGMPEAVLGFSLFSIVGVGYPLLLIGRPLAESDLALARVLLSVSSVCLSAGWVGILVFTWKVFRPDSALARGGTLCAAGILAICLAASIVGLVALDSPEPIGVPTRSSLWTQAVALLAYVWTAAESFSHYRRHGKRQALGLSDPVLTNRFLMWGLVMVFSFISLVVPFAVSLTGRNATESPPALATTAVAGLACSVLLYLAFLPPAAYRHWLEHRAATA